MNTNFIILKLFLFKFFAKILQQFLILLNAVMEKVFNVCVTGAAGQIAYSFIPQLLKGNVFPNVLIDLRMLDIPQAQKALEGVIMEIHDCTYPLLKNVMSTSKPEQAFKDADVIVFLGGFPRKPGMQRKDLLQLNKKIFEAQSEALSVAKPDVKCVVVANPANTNAFILANKNSKIKKENITCLSRLDHNRAISQLALKASCGIDQIQGVMIFGNHSLTQYPCLHHLMIKGVPAKQVIDEQWLKNDFITKVQKRGGQILAARNGSSVFSAANAVVDHLRDWYLGSQKIISMGVRSNGQYGVPEGLWSSFPVTCKNFQYKIVEGLQLSQFCKQNIKITCDELKEQISLAGF